MGVGRGERNYVLGTQNIFQLKSEKQEREAKFGTRERRKANLGTRKKNFEKARGNAEREEEMKERGHAKGLQERAPSSAKYHCICYCNCQMSSVHVYFFLALGESRGKSGVSFHLCNYTHLLK